MRASLIAALLGVVSFFFWTLPLHADEKGGLNQKPRIQPIGDALTLKADELVLRRYDSLQRAIQTLSSQCGSDCSPPASSCKSFLKENCELGAMGVFIKKTLKDGQFHTRSDSKKPLPARTMVEHPPSDFAQYCPGYSKFNSDRKMDFWVWVLMHLAFEESTCNEDTTNPANRNTVGMLQLESSAKKRKSLRPPECTDSYIQQTFGKKATLNTPQANMMCGMAMLSVQVAAPGSLGSETRSDLKVLSKGKLFSGGSYWAQLRKPQGDIARELIHFPGCKITPKKK